MIEQINENKDGEGLENVPRTMTLARRPLRSSELGVPSKLDDPEEVLDLIHSYGLFYTVQEPDQTIHFDHKSAKDDFTDGQKETSAVFPFGQAACRSELGCELLSVMSHSLKQDICSVKHVDVLRDEIDDDTILSHISE